MKKNKGLFLSFEGGEGAGKSTQIELLSQFLTQENYDVLITRQPGGTLLGQGIRSLILDVQDQEPVSASAELFLYLADRCQHVQAVIKPALAEGKIILCDRYIDSTLAYQGYGRGFPLERLKQLNQWATEELLPDLTFWFDLSPEQGLQRISSRQQDRLEQESLQFHQRVYEGYLQIFKENPQRLIQINAERSIQDIHSKIKETVINWF